MHTSSAPLGSWVPMVNYYAPTKSYLTAQDHFAGCGGGALGLDAAGIEITISCNHDQRSVNTHQRNFPHHPHYVTDITRVNPADFARTDIGLFTPECFPAGTLILTTRGLVPIEQVQVGDLVMTHQGRWRPVEAARSSHANTVISRGMGHYGLESTAAHPFYSRTRKRFGHRQEFLYSEPDWTPAGQLAGKAWATPKTFAPLSVPPIEGRRGQPFSQEFWWMVGRWLGDGLVRIRERSAEVTICCGKHEAAELRERLNFAPEASRTRARTGELHWTERELRTAVLFQTAHIALAKWLVSNFGRRAHGKTIPAWALSMPTEDRRALLEGYISADGHRRGRGKDNKAVKTYAVTVSKSLAIGTRLLASSLDYHVSISRNLTNSTSIEGRSINARPTYQLGWVENRQHEYGASIEGHIWLPVKEVVAGRSQVEVFNLQVAEDESYVADGLVVHNCKFHTKARGMGLKFQSQLLLWDDVQPDDPNATRSRMLMNEVLRFVAYHRYWAVVVENVVECYFYWSGMPQWLQTMSDLGYDGELICFNSQFAPDHPHAAPQSRERGYYVFWRRDIGRRPNLELRPPACCEHCNEEINAVQCWKDLRKPKIGKWKQQYLYRCPRCANEVRPRYTPVWTALDFSIPMPTLGERKEPLEESTLRRIRAGMAKFGYNPLLLDLGLNYQRKDGSEAVRAWPLSEAAPTQTTAQTLGFLVPMAYDHLPSPLNEVAPTMTARNDVGVVLPFNPFMVEMHGTSTARSITEPCGSVLAGGNHHGICAPAAFAGFLSSYYSGSDQNGLIVEPCPTIPTVDRHALVRVPENLRLEDVRFRMLDPNRELKRIMGFPANYVILGSKRDQTRQLGNSLTPNVIAEIIFRVREILAPELVGKTLFPVVGRSTALAA